MAKSNKPFVKEQTVQRLVKLKSKYNTKEALIASDEYNSLINHYANKFERDNMNTIVDLVMVGKTLDEIRLIIKAVPAAPQSDNTDMDPVEDATVFMVATGKVVTIDEPVTVNIGNDESHDEAVEPATVNAETADHDRKDEPIDDPDIFGEPKMSYVEYIMKCRTDAKAGGQTPVYPTYAEYLKAVG